MFQPQYPSELVRTARWRPYPTKILPDILSWKETSTPLKVFLIKAGLIFSQSKDEKLAAKGRKLAMEGMSVLTLSEFEGLNENDKAAMAVLAKMMSEDLESGKGLESGKETEPRREKDQNNEK